MGSACFPWAVRGGRTGHGTGRHGRLRGGYDGRGGPAQARGATPHPASERAAVLHRARAGRAQEPAPASPHAGVSTSDEALSGSSPSMSSHLKTRSTTEPSVGSAAGRLLGTTP